MLGTVAIVLLVKYTVHCIYLCLYCFLFHNRLLLPFVVNKDGYITIMVIIRRAVFCMRISIHAVQIDKKASSRSRDNLVPLSDVLTSLKPSEFTDFQLARYKVPSPH